MANPFSGIARQLASMMRQDEKKDATDAVITRVDNDGTAWAILDGASIETPCEMSSVAVSPGQRVSVRVKDGVSTITGNYSAPATDDSMAKSALGKAEKADKTGKVALGEARGANGFINTNLAVDEDGFWVGNENVTYKILESPGATESYTIPGVYIIDETGNVVGRFGEDVYLAPADLRIHITPDRFFVGLGDDADNDDEDGSCFIIKTGYDGTGLVQVVSMVMKGTAYFGDSVDFDGRVRFSDANDKTVALCSQVANSGNIAIARRGQIVSMKLEAHGMKQASTEIRIDLPAGYVPVHDVHTGSGLVITTDSKLVIPASLRNGQDLVETVIWCAENQYGSIVS